MYVSKKHMRAPLEKISRFFTQTFYVREFPRIHIASTWLMNMRLKGCEYTRIKKEVSFCLRQIYDNGVSGELCVNGNGTNWWQIDYKELSTSHCPPLSNTWVEDSAHSVQTKTRGYLYKEGFLLEETRRQQFNSYMRPKQANREG